MESSCWAPVLETQRETSHVFMGENAKQTKFLITTATMGAILDIQSSLKTQSPSCLKKYEWYEHIKLVVCNRVYIWYLYEN